MTDASDFRSAYGKGDVALPVKGSCQCGQLRYQSENEPVIAFHCSCSRCQKFSGTDRGSFLIFADPATSITGEARSWSYDADSGARTTRYFCPICGTHVFGRTDAHPQNIVIAASSLDDPAGFRPTVHLFAAQVPQWKDDDRDLVRFAAGPA